MRLYRNDLLAGNSITIILKSEKDNRNGIGAKIILDSGIDSLLMTRYISLGRGFMSSNQPIAHFGIGNLEMVKQMHSKEIDIYISVKLEKIISHYEIFILGWCSKKDFLKINRIENNGYLDNVVLYDNELRNIKTLLKYI